MTTEELNRTFAALADPTRRAILARLATGEATVTELAEPFPVSLPAISKHLKVLERAGLIMRGRAAQWRPCRLRPAPLEDAAEWLEDYRQFWEGSFDRLADHLQEIQKGERMPESRSTARATGREVTITRVFDAPRELVWKAWTEPEHFSHWFGSPPFTTPLSTISMDVRPGGAWRATMVSQDDGTELPFMGVYREVVEPERLVLTFDDPNDPSNPNVEVLTVTFADLGDKTEVVAHQAGHLPEDEYPKLAEGYSSFFDRLAEHLAQADA